MSPQVTKQNQGSVPPMGRRGWPLQKIRCNGVLGGLPPKIEMYFLCWTSQNEDQQHERRNRESEVCRCEARAETMAMVHILQTSSATRTGAVHMGRSISLAINQKSGIHSPFFCRGTPLRPVIMGL